MFRPVILVLFFLINNSLNLLAQADSLNYTVLHGRIVDDSLSFGIPFVNIWNESSRQGEVSNKAGEFTIKVKENDTLIFNILGYSHELVIVTRGYLNKNLLIRLKPKFFEIGEVVVTRYRNYEEFKEDFLKLDLSDERTDNIRRMLNELGTNIALEADRERAVKDKLNGFGYTSGLSGRKSKQQLKEEEVKRLKIRSKIINEKYSRELVRDITRLRDNELTKFMSYCNFSEDYLYKSDLFTIIDAISNKFSIYQTIVDTIPNVN